MKFRNKQTKVIVEVTGEFVIGQMKKNDLYEEVKEQKVFPKETSPVKFAEEETKEEYKKSSKVK